MMSPQARAENILGKVRQEFGFVPNVIKEMVHSPAVAELYFGGIKTLRSASLNEREIQAISLTVAAFNGCSYCVAAHCTIAKKSGIDEKDIEALSKGDAPENNRLKTLTIASQLILEKKGWLNEMDLSDLADKGIDKTQIYEIVAVIGLKTLATYINHIAHTPIDKEFAPLKP
ncbi:MAG: carboxymuconolactone decarboxylase family protein [Nitrospinae bacterium]|nr:carboxymuconolactone decarboxylase family protein [Nitrospinota bacterium]